MQVPQAEYDAFGFISDDWRRRRYHAMVAHVDGQVGRIVDALRARQIFDSTILFFSSDNGGPIYQDGAAGSNNWPLKGGKASNWEGGPTSH